MTQYTLSDLDDRLTRIEFVFAQLKWAAKDSSAEERALLPSCGLSPEEVEKILCLLGTFASIVRSFQSIDCPGPRCRASETNYEIYKSGGGTTAA